ncbi:zinc finger CCCH domain-containing protein 10-like [Ptychodera flava]|uniref:zinc finger CCCH domain-containing protein 10-like n=1 Tax=Ptychodera flava TaxID=63121 RepID=UPI00396AA218
MSNDRKDNDGIDDKAICRDFLRNVCRRGKNCKYEHPDNSEAEKLGLKQKSHVFCHDFQNKECRRPNCKFIHCTREEEEFYKSTGDLPSRVQGSVGAGPLNDSMNDGDIPVCRDFLKGECRRGVRCKFRHMSQGDYEFHLRSRQRDPPPRSRFDDPFEPRREFDDYDFERMRKRSRADLDYELQRDFLRPRGYEYRELEEEIIMLRRKVDELKKQVSDLSATNEVLLDQNARLRASKLRNSPTPDGARLRTVTSYSQVVPTAQNHPQLTNAAITINSDLSGPQQPVLTAEQQQLIAQEIQPLVSLAQAISTPGSAGCITSIAPAITPASISQSLQTQIPMSGQNSQMVSYPIVSQSMRTLTQSSLAP